MSRSLTSSLFKAARVSATGRAVVRTHHTVRRSGNLIIGKALARGGFWKTLWR